MDALGTITQLNAARDIVLGDAAIYPQIVPGVLPVIGPSQSLELRRWGSDFLAETFASPVVNAEDKAAMCVGVLDTLNGYLGRKENLGEEEDASVLKSAIQCVASIYPLVFRHVITHAEASATEAWSKMMSMKSAILRRMDTAPAGVRICCIKFAARVVQVQTPGLIADPRKPDHNEISLALVPREHAVLNPSNLEAEASGLLDRLLSVLQDNIHDALVVTATLNALSLLVHRRATIANKILGAILGFNPIQKTTTGEDKIAAKSMTRTTMSFLNNVIKRNIHHPLGGRIQAQLDRLRQAYAQVFIEQNGLKRSLDDSEDGPPPNKRHHPETGPGGTSVLVAPPLPPGLVSYKDLYTLTTDPRTMGLHVQALPQQIVAQLVPALLKEVNPAQFDQALNILRARVLEVQRRPSMDPTASAMGTNMAGFGDDEEDEYDPTAFGAGEADEMDPDVGFTPQQSLEVMQLPPESPLSEEERAEYGEQARQRLFGTLREMDEDASKKRGEKKTISDKDEVLGFNRPIIAVDGGHERESWITLLIRMATRSAFSVKESGEANGDANIKEEGADQILVKNGGTTLSSRIRDALNRYIMDDWRRRIDVAIAWLNEEWYADRIAAKNSSSSSTAAATGSLPNYTPWTLALLDQLVPYLDTKDGRYLIRFLSEIPFLPADVFERIRKIAEDPERVHISTQTLLYLIMLRPPVRERAIECAGEIWRENKDARAQVEKILVKWRPEMLERNKDGPEAVKQEA